MCPAKSLRPSRRCGFRRSKITLVIHLIFGDVFVPTVQILHRHLNLPTFPSSGSVGAGTDALVDFAVRVARFLL
jgi:hypothetical protein